MESTPDFIRHRHSITRKNHWKKVTVHRQAFSELKMPYDTVVAADFADLECEASAKSVTGTRYEWTVTKVKSEIPVSALFPFKYPINCDILYFGGIPTNIWIWSGIKCPSIIFTPLYLHNVLMISLISSLYWLYFWCEYNMIFTHPFCMCHRICLICH